MSCSGVRQALADCLLKTDCVLKQGRTPSECLQEHADELPMECQHLRKAFFECKRGMLDMRSGGLDQLVTTAAQGPDASLTYRKRFRGIEPGQIKTTPAQEQGGQ